MKVLITEDNVMLADFLEDAITELGHAVCGVARDVAAAVDLVRVYRPDVAIIDMQLAGTQRGSDIVDQLVATGDLRHTGILYATGEADRVYQEAQFGHACLKKPYSLDTLEVALEIVREIAVDQRLSRPLPHGMGLLVKVQMSATQTARRTTPGAAATRFTPGSRRGAGGVDPPPSTPATGQQPP